ncbi:MAG: crossover junction endodeoxyribonuclease RuvC [Leptospiraceae bacterium]|nr:crossover junction endodeoxyribonuclease RuvC [Leptospiraceae bacterium]
MRILGLDPGFGITGWGFVSYRGSSLNQPTLHSYGALTTPGRTPLAFRLADLQTQFVELLGRLQPDRVAMEKLFFGRNITTAEGVYQARGVLLAALGRAGMVPIELTPNQIKQSVTGSGKAGKPEMMRMVQMLLNIDEPIRPDDAADALGCAIAASAYSDQEFRRLQNPSLADDLAEQSNPMGHKDIIVASGSAPRGTESESNLSTEGAEDFTALGSEIRLQPASRSGGKNGASPKKSGSAKKSGKLQSTGPRRKSTDGASGAKGAGRRSAPQANQKNRPGPGASQEGAQQ